MPAAPSSTTPAATPRAAAWSAEPGREVGAGRPAGHQRSPWRLPVATRVLHHPGDQLLERMPGVPGLFGGQRSRGHTWLGVDLEADELAVLTCPVVETEIRPRHAPAPKRSMRLERHLLHFVVNFRLNLGWNDVS